MKSLGSTENKITKDKNGENVLYLEITEIILVHRNIVNHDYLHDWRVLYTFAQSKLFDQLSNISPKNFVLYFFVLYFRVFVHWFMI